MNAKALSKRLEQLSAKLWDEQSRLDKLHSLTSDYATACYDISLPYDESYKDKSAVQEKAAKRLEALSYALSGIESTLQEAAWSVDEIVDLIEELIPLNRRSKAYNPPDAWK